MKARIVYFDFLRGLAILMVIAIHTFSIVDLTSDSNLEIFLRQILNCAVPIFLAISGFFISKGNKVGTYWAFLKHQIPKIYIPCLLWSVPYLLLYLNHNGDVFKALFYFIFCGFSIYYFIALIMQYYILSPVLIKLKSGGVILTLLITLLAISLVTYIMQVEGHVLPLIIYAGGFPVWLIFFVIGLRLGNISNRNYEILPYLFCAFFFLLLSFIEAKYLYSFNQGGFGIKLSSHLYSLSMILLLFSRKVEVLFERISDSWLCRGVVYIGSVSFGVYLIHCFFISLVKKFVEVDWGWFSLSVIVLFLSIGFIYIVKKIFPKLSVYLGFR